MAVIRDVAVRVPVGLRLGVRVFDVVVVDVTVANAETDLVVDGEMVFVGVKEGVCVLVSVCDPVWDAVRAAVCVIVCVCVPDCVEELV